MSEQRGPAPGPEPVPEPGRALRLPVSVPVAAKALGISERAVRKRIHAGTLQAEPFGRSFMVWLPDDAPPPGPEPGPEPGPDHVPEPGPEPFASVSPAVVEQAIVRTGQQYTADLRALLAELRQVYEGEIAAKDQTIAAKDEALAAKDETIDALRRRAELAEERASNELAERAALVAAKNQMIAEVQHRADLAEQEAAALRAQLVPPAVAQDATAGADSTAEASASPAPAAGLWARLGRWWRGEGEP